MNKGDENNVDFAQPFSNSKNATDEEAPAFSETGLYDAYEELTSFLKETSGADTTMLPETTTNIDEETIDVVSRASTGFVVEPKGQDLIPNTMNSGIFAFNKVMIDTLYEIICTIYPVNGSKRDYARFYVLETVARIPYFAYLTVLHFQETFGQRGQTEKMRTHYAEADNELHHLLIMEELGGNSKPLDRIFAQTMSFFYFWYVILVYSWNPSAAYHLSELIEAHVFKTYDGFTSSYKDLLEQQPVPDIATKYYERDDPYLFDLVCGVKDDCTTPNQRRRKLNNLYDVFMNIRDDENEHWKTLCNLVQYDDMNAVDSTKVHATQSTSESRTVTDKKNE